MVDTTHDEGLKRYVLEKGLLSAVITVLFILAGIAVNGYVPASEVFNPTSVIASLLITCITYFLLTYFVLRTSVVEQLDEQGSELTIAFIAVMVFISIEIYNILISIVTGTSYFPTNPAFRSNFWINKGLNLLLAGIATGIVAYITRKDLKNL